MLYTVQLFSRLFFSGWAPVQIRVEESGSFCIRLLFIQNMLLQAVHILSANILVVTQGYGFNVK